MYVSNINKFREATIEDLIFEFKLRVYSDGTWKIVKIQRLIECMVYFEYTDGKLRGPYKTPSNGSCPDRFYQIYTMILRKEILLLEPRAVAPFLFQKKVWYKKANSEDIERNTLFFELSQDRLLGPWTIDHDITSYDTVLINKINNNQIYVINERQQF